MSAIQTVYRGHKFRSRLEARWAVMFDYLAIKWQYEVEDYEWIDESLPSETYRYLPDFYFPERKCYGEVKGLPTLHELRMLASAAVPHWGLPGNGSDGNTGNRLVILGELPDQNYAPHGVMLDWHKGDVFWSLWTPHSWGPHYGERLYGDNGDFNRQEAYEVKQLLMRNDEVWCRYPHEQKAATAARQARFEHGEQPAKAWV